MPVRPAQGYRVCAPPCTAAAGRTCPGERRRSPGTGPRKRRPDPGYWRSAQPRSRSAADRTGAAAGSTISWTRPACWPGRVLDADVLDVDARTARVREDPGQLAGLVADQDGHDLVRRRGGAVLARDAHPAGVAAAQDVLDALRAVAALGLVGGLQGPQRPDRLVEVGGDARRARRRPVPGSRRGCRSTSGGRRPRCGSHRGCPARRAVPPSRPRPPAAPRPSRRSAAGCGRPARRPGRGRRRP